MSGLFRRLFAPRWQHPDPGVRRQAAERLDTAHPEQHQALERLALDADPGVRSSALARLDDPVALLLLLEGGEASHELTQRLVMLVTGLEGPHDLDSRIAIVERLEDPVLLADIAMKGDNQQLRLAALAKLEDEDALIRQACDNGIAAIRHAAAARVESEAGLARLAQSARRDRQVMRQARERLNRLRADAASLAAASAKRDALIDTLERHAKAAWEPLYAGRFRHLMRAWEALGDVPDAKLERRYQDACLRCRKVIGDHEAQQRSRDADHLRREGADQSREALIDALEESLDALHRSERITDQDIASLRAQKHLLATRWQELSDQHLADEALVQRYDAALQAFDRIAQARIRLDERADAIEQALQEGDDERLQALIDTCAWPDSLSPTPLLARARERLAASTADTAEQQTSALERFSGELIELERLLESGSFKSASRLHHGLRHQAEGLQQARGLPRSRLASELATLKRLGAQLAELRDWRGFVAGPKRDQLCHAIDELADNATLTDVELDRRHRQLAKEWKSLGDAAANREQSARFRTASERIHERLGPWRQRLEGERQKHLEDREALCEKLETLLAQPAHQADPDALRQIRDRAREQWRHSAPVPREHAEAIGRRFARIRHELQTLIDRRAREIADAKRELIDQTRQLSEHDIPATRRAEQAKALQQRWRELGRAPRGEEQALWREFRSICDTIFASREVERGDQLRRDQERLDAMQALIDRLDSWQPVDSRDAPLLEQATQEAAALEPLPSGRRTEGMRRRWSGIVRARRERLTRLGVVDEVNRWRHVQPLLAAHLEADAACLAGERVTDVPPSETLVLGDDMLSAHARRNASRHEPPGETVVEERLARLRVHLSLLAVGRVSQRDEPLRLAIQVERLNENLGREPSRAEELHGVLLELLGTGPVPPSLWTREVGELDHMLETLARLPPP
jgi:lysophospholipase L1-like esterase